MGEPDPAGGVTLETVFMTTFLVNLCLRCAVSPDSTPTSSQDNELGIDYNWAASYQSISGHDILTLKVDHAENN